VTLTAKDVAEITRLLEESSFDELYLELEGMKLSLRRNGAAGRPVSAPSRAEQAPGAAAVSAPAAAGGRPVSSTLSHPVSNPAAAAPSGASGVAPAATSTGAHEGGRPVSAQPASRPGATSPPQAAPAPLLGTYYRAPKPGAPPYVEVGSTVEEDTIVGIIEVMKLMNTVRAGVRGRVTDIVARDGTLVEYGETLLQIAKSG
jgi:acetyl-CoA carboxylase biotin carboxyl carrier protein